MINNAEHLAVLRSPARQIKARVEHYKGSTLYKTYNHTDNLKSLSIDRAGTHKFFGVGVCQTAEITLLDKNREITVDNGDSFKIYFGIDDSFICNFPLFYVAENTTRDENTNEIKVKGWDKIANEATKKTIEELTIEFPATIADYATVAANALGLVLSYPEENTHFTISFAETANYAGTESLRDLLDDVAEATQTIYYVGSNGELIFKPLIAETALTIGKADYFTLTSKDAVILANIGQTTELGDNITAYSGIEGATQYIRSNGFLELREDTAEILNSAIAATYGLAINPIACEWRGNYLLEIGDCVELTTKDNDAIFCYLLDEKISYGGGLKSSLNWEYAGDEETASNPSTLGEVLNQTFARVDKAAKSVEIVVSEVAENSQNITSLQLTTGGISADVAELDAAVSAAMTAEDVRLEIKREIAENGIDKVITNTGFTFDDSGLTVSKSGTEMSTLISEDGMSVSKNGSEVLSADNTGVKAVNLHATTYLIVSETSRFENYGNNRTGCFWIGG